MGLQKVCGLSLEGRGALKSARASIFGKAHRSPFAYEVLSATAGYAAGALSTWSGLLRLMHTGICTRCPLSRLRNLPNRNAEMYIAIALTKTGYRN